MAPVTPMTTEDFPVTPKPQPSAPAPAPAPSPPPKAHV